MLPGMMLMGWWWTGARGEDSRSAFHVDQFLRLPHQLVDLALVILLLFQGGEPGHVAATLLLLRLVTTSKELCEPAPRRHCRRGVSSRW